MSASVVVTGASTGIGRATAEFLAHQGFVVWAGVRREQDAPAARTIRPLLLDVTDIGTVEVAARTVEADGARLAGLVNNAGIAVNGPVELVELDDWRRQFEVNVFGLVAVTRAFLPQLRTARGRVVNVSSIGGRMALPFVGPYNASKFAVEAISDSLRQEVRPFGIHVVVIEPGSIATPVWDKSIAAGDAQLATSDPGRLALYRTSVDQMREVASRTGAAGLPPRAVAEVIADALTSPKPRTRYLVGRDAKARAALRRVLPDRAMDALVRRATGVG